MHGMHPNHQYGIKKMKNKKSNESELFSEYINSEKETEAEKTERLKKEYKNRTGRKIPSA